MQVSCEGTNTLTRWQVDLCSRQQLEKPGVIVTEQQIDLKTPGSGRRWTQRVMHEDNDIHIMCFTANPDVDNPKAEVWPSICMNGQAFTLILANATQLK